MIVDNYDPLKSLKLIKMDNHFDYLVKLFNSNKFPKVMLLSGKKGSGKFTLINHFLNYILSKDTYDIENKIIDPKSKTYIDQSNNILSNIIHLKNEGSETIKIDSIRNLKTIISKTIINNKPRFIIIDDSENMSTNVSNAILKIIEEPTKDNYFILIDNQQKNIIETISSRCFKSKIFIEKSDEITISKYLIEKYKLEENLDYYKLGLTPGLFLRYSVLCSENNITSDLEYLTKIERLLSLYKKSKDKSYINLSILFTNFYFYDLTQKNNKNIFLYDNTKKKIISLINDFLIYNLNLNNILNLINSYFKYAK